MKARIKPEWLTAWQSACAEYGEPFTPLPASLSVGAIVTADETTITREYDRNGENVLRFIDIVGDDGRTASIDMAMLEVIE